VALAFCEYWRGLAAVNDANVLQLWDVEGLQMRWSAQLPGRFRLLAVAPDDPWVAVLDHGGRLLLFHSKTGALRANLTLERAAGQAEQGEPAVALAPDGQGVAVLWDGEVRLWELDRVGAPPR
jgi:hypothetical protein